MAAALAAAALTRCSNNNVLYCSAECPLLAQSGHHHCANAATFDERRPGTRKPRLTQVAAMSSDTRIVICGGGAIGAAIAYFTSRRGARSTVIERHAVAGAASGKSGGFLALDWCCGSPLDRLARRSFELHAELS